MQSGRVVCFRDDVNNIFKILPNKIKSICPKTKKIAKLLNECSLSKFLIITDYLDINLYISARNIPNVDVITVREINPINLHKPQKVAVTSEALKQIEEWVNG